MTRLDYTERTNFLPLVERAWNKHFVPGKRTSLKTLVDSIMHSIRQNQFIDKREAIDIQVALRDYLKPLIFTHSPEFLLEVKLQRKEEPVIKEPAKEETEVKKKPFRKPFNSIQVSN